MAVSEAGRPKALEDGNFRRKKLSAVQILDLAGMHELAARKWQRTPLSATQPSLLKAPFRLSARLSIGR